MPLVVERAAPAAAAARGDRSRIGRPGEVQTRARRRALVDAAKAMLAQAPGASHPLDDVAAALGVSASHLAHVFRDEAGVSFHQYLLQMRMSLALGRLSSGPRDLSRLALDLGFATHSHFTSAFRRAYGIAPSCVRELLEARAAEVRR